MLGRPVARRLVEDGIQVKALARRPVAARQLLPREVSVVTGDLEKPGEDDVFRKIRRDFDAHGVNVSDHQIRRTMTELMANAIEQIKAGR